MDLGNKLEKSILGKIVLGKMVLGKMVLEKEKLNKIHNKGTGAGGANTNLNGKNFEELTSSIDFLKSNGFIQNSYYLERTADNRTTIFLSQTNLKKYIKSKENITLFRNPDEAIIDYIVGDIPTIYVLEKKEQNVEGSVETKLWSGPALKREYEIALENHYKIEYAFCLSDFLKKKMLSGHQKYNILRQILEENHITVFYGQDPDYLQQFYGWFNNS